MGFERDFEAFVKVTIWVISSTTYARFAASLTKPGALRLFALLPVVILLPFLPFYFTSINLRGTAAFFLAWLGVFKLLLLAFNSGPLSPSLPLIPFIAIAALPVKIRPNTKSHPTFPRFFLTTSIKFTLFALSVSIYKRASQIHPWLALAFQCLYIYLSLELVLAYAAFLAGFLLGLGLEPQVDAPFKSTSLQDFWGRRWNLMVTGILRPSVYNPVRSRFGVVAGVLVAFLVSGLMHEVMFYYLTLEGPTGEVTLFFMLHGFCTVAEVKAKKSGWWNPRPVVGTAVTLGFVVGTAFWLFFPQLLRGGADEKGLEECMEVLRLMEVGRMTLLSWLTG